MRGLYHADCFDLLARMPDKCVDAIITDPPYCYLEHKLDKPFDFDRFFAEAHRVLKKDSFICFFGKGDAFFEWNMLCKKYGSKGIEDCWEFADAELKNPICWYKGTTTTPTISLQRSAEPFVIRRKGRKTLNKIRIDKIENKLSMSQTNALTNDLRNLQKIFQTINKLLQTEEKTSFYDKIHKLFNDKIGNETESRKHSLTYRDSSKFKARNRDTCQLTQYVNGTVLQNVFHIAREHYQMQHPTQKPIELMRRLVLLLTNEDEVVFDPFMGGGSTLIAASQLNRQIIGAEIDKDYYDIAISRLRDEIVDSQLKIA